ncbi:MAG: hypothetical protein DKM50_12885 [Candidatus Margulisiibacteriota bacterium]|nr:MAG: hypothetical protein DKM50_12885 [Candidatus Margulisiibacteriota bacterium]HCY36220.1 hypothetical protein [Candidatus Margulisiibacteriota bacterium]
MVICLRCKIVINKKIAIPHPHSPDKLFCPHCKRLLFDLGHEEALLSPAEQIERYDLAQHPHNKKDVVNYYEEHDTDVKILGCLDAVQSKADDVEARITLSRLYLIKKQYNLALEEAYTAISYAGETKETVGLLSDIFAASEDYNSASKYCIKILQKNPNDIGSRYNLAIALFYLGNYSSAANQFKKILQIDPTNKDAKNAIKEMKKYLIK